MSFGKALPFGIKQQGRVGVLRNCLPQEAQQQDLPWRGGQYVPAAKDMGDAHVRVIRSGGKMVGNDAV